MHYGADYNPEQWPEELWPEDVARMREAGVTMVSLGIFSWARIQPREGEFDFGWLDRVIDLLHEGGIAVDLATATASPPPWASAAYPELLPQDEDGAVYWPGSRQQFAPSSPVYRRLAAELVTAIAERYAQHPAVVMWHVNNEYGCHLNMDYSDAARDAFRRWLADRYGTVDALNVAWGTNFWSQRYQSFDEVFPPRKAPYSLNPGQMLDYRRFTSDMLLECYLMERDLLRAAGATQPITTNFMGPFKPANYAQWAEHLDLVSDDAYPDPNDPESFRAAAFQRDLVRSLKPEVPWILMEQATNALNWRPSNAPKAPGQMAALSAQAIGRGADGILFFQWRQSRAGAEKFHSAMLPHSGTDTRTWREAVALGGQLAALPALPAGARDARVALVFDWENWWAVEASDHPSNVLDYLEVVQRWYRALHRRHVQVDIVPPERVDDRYALAIAPLLYLLRDEGAAALTAFVEGGGSPPRRPVHRHRRRGRPVPRGRLPHAARRSCAASASRTSARSSHRAPPRARRASGRRVSRETRCPSRPARCSPRRSRRRMPRWRPRSRAAAARGIRPSPHAAPDAASPATWRRCPTRRACRRSSTTCSPTRGSNRWSGGSPSTWRRPAAATSSRSCTTAAATTSTCPSPVPMPCRASGCRRCGSAPTTGRWCSSDDGERSPGLRCTRERRR